MGNSINTTFDFWQSLFIVTFAPALQNILKNFALKFTQTFWKRAAVLIFISL